MSQIARGGRLIKCDKKQYLVSFGVHFRKWTIKVETKNFKRHEKEEEKRKNYVWEASGASVTVGEVGEFCHWKMVKVDQNSNK